jgi:hypothetical protein
MKSWTAARALLRHFLWKVVLLCLSVSVTFIHLVDFISYIVLAFPKRVLPSSPPTQSLDSLSCRTVFLVVQFKLST